MIHRWMNRWTNRPSGKQTLIELTIDFVFLDFLCDDFGLQNCGDIGAKTATSGKQFSSQSCVLFNASAEIQTTSVVKTCQGNTCIKLWLFMIVKNWLNCLFSFVMIINTPDNTTNLVDSYLMFFQMKCLLLS